jgi:hypothetical protein
LPDHAVDVEAAIAAASDPRRELLDLLPAARPAPLAGRRLYVHERSLHRLAFVSRCAAHDVYTCLARISVLKTIHHQVRHDGVCLGLIAAGPAERVLERLRDTWSDRISRWFHRIRVWARRRPGSPRAAEPLLRPAEAVVASCYFAGYYTFATGCYAADRMYRDQRDIAELRRRLVERSSEGDLALVSGRLIPEEEGPAGGGPRRWQDPDRRRPAMLAISQAARVRMEVLAAIRVEAAALTADLGLTAGENGYLRDRVDRALEVVFSRGILKTL